MMKNLLRKAQSDVAEQIQESGIATDGPSIKKIVATGAFVLASAFSMMAPAQAQQNTGNILSNTGAQLGQVLGQQAGRGQNMGNEYGQILGVTLGTLGKVLGGQQVNGADVAGTVGQVTGAVVGYKVAGDSPTARTIGVLLGGAGGAILGNRVGNSYDMNKANEQTSAIPLSVADQQGFVEGMRTASAKRQPAPSTQFMQNGSGPTQINPQQAGYSGYMANTMQKLRLPLLSSGAREMPNEVMLAVGNKAMEVVKVGQAYNQTTNAWDNAFLNNRTPAVKTDVNNALVDMHDLLKAKTFEYVQVRNAAASQGYDVSLIDGSVASNLAGLRDQTNFGFRVAQRGSQLTNNY